MAESLAYGTALGAYVSHRAEAEPDTALAFDRPLRHATVIVLTAEYGELTQLGQGKEMADEIDWRGVRFAGNRRRQREKFRALPLGDKLIAIEHDDMLQGGRKHAALTIG